MTTRLRFGLASVLLAASLAADAAFVEVTGVANPFNGVDVGQDATPVFADLDGDGDKDALVGERDGPINFFRSTDVRYYALQVEASRGTFGTPEFVSRTLTATVGDAP